MMVYFDDIAEVAIVYHIFLSIKKQIDVYNNLQNNNL